MRLFGPFDAREAPDGVEPQGEQLLPGKCHQRSRSPPPLPGAEVVPEEAPAPRADAVERGPQGEQRLGAPAELRERESQQRRLAEVIGAVIGEHVEEIMGEDAAIVEPVAHRIEPRRALLTLPARLDAVLELEEAARLEPVALEVREIGASETPLRHASQHSAIRERREQ